MQIRRLYHCIIFVMSVSTAPVFAQVADIYGKVIDNESGKSLSPANVALISQATQRTIGAVSAEDGTYQITHITPGIFRLEVSFIGYKRLVIESITLAAGESRQLNVTLTQEALEMEEIVVSSRHQSIDRRSIEKLEATASVTVLDTLKIQSVQPLSAADHLLGLAGVHVAKTGLTQSNVAIRGFNDIFSSSYLLMVDNRIARIPSIRFNAYNFIPTSNEDIERIEIIRGPAASLYGPNSANGVLHIVSKSPLASKGTTLNIGFGQRNTTVADFRYAGRPKEKLAYKITGTFIQGTDFESHDAVEDSIRVSLIEAEEFCRENLLENPNPETVETSRIGLRDFQTEKVAATAQVEYAATPDLMLVGSGGINWANNLELTQIGAAVIDNWRYLYGHGKLMYKNLFMQAFVNASDAGTSYFLRDGSSLVDRSKLFSYQIQNTTEIGDRISFTYGLDVLLTRPETEGTVNGDNEQDDNIDEVGVYLQSETDLWEKFKLVLAGRLDQHSRLDGLFVSPKAGIVITPKPGNRLRFSVGQAFTTPTTTNLFLDRLISPLIPNQLISNPFLNFQPFNIRARGVPETGLTFRRDSGGGIDGLYMQPVPLYFSESESQQFIPADATLLWRKAVEIVTGFENTGLESRFGSLRRAPAPTSEQVLTALKVFNSSTREFEPIDPGQVANIEDLNPTRTISFEFGYKGVINDRLFINTDFYYNRIEDFIGPLLLETPNVFLDRATLEDYLQPLELFDQGAAVKFAEWMSQLPLGTVTPDQSNHPGDLILSHRNFGDINLFGADFDVSYRASERFILSGTYSYVNKNLFRNVDNLRDIALHAPKNKFSAEIRYKPHVGGVDGGLRFRFVQGFPVRSGVYSGEVESYGIFDLSTGYNLPGQSGVRLALTIQNLFNNMHEEFVGGAEIGRLALFQLKYFPDRNQ